MKSLHLDHSGSLATPAKDEEDHVFLRDAVKHDTPRKRQLDSGFQALVKRIGALECLLCLSKN